MLDLGAGTGKLTRVLVDRYARVVAVEPLEGMRQILERVVPRAESFAGAAEAIPFPDGAVDGVFAASAFHWFANDEAIAEVARVLRRGGVFAVVWNETIDPSPLPEPYLARTQVLFDDVRQDANLEEDRFDVIARGPFGELHEAAVEHEQRQTRDLTLSFLRSISVVAKRPPDEREALMAELGALLPEGEYVFRIRAIARWAVRV